MSNIYSQIYLQFIFAVRHRQRLIPKEHKIVLHKFIGRLVQKTGAKLLAVNCMPEHTHLLVCFNPSLPVADFAKEIKAEAAAFINSKKWIQKYFSWQEGHAVFSYAHADIAGLTADILYQETYHEQVTFKKEYLGLLREFNIPFEEKTVFDLLELPEAAP